MPAISKDFLASYFYKLQGGLKQIGQICAIFLLTAQSTAAQPSLNDGVIEGRVVSGHGPEAGVWVIAETDDLATHFVKIVVTDDAGNGKQGFRL